jgi:hypothetical protein
VPATAGSGGAAANDAGAPDPMLGLTGMFGPKSFSAVKAAFVIGLTGEFGTTTVYLLDHPVTCEEISSFGWLAGLSTEVQVIEIMFLTMSATGTLVTSSVISHGEGGMLSLSKTVANPRTLVLSRNEAAGAVDGQLDATFSSGRVSGTFHAEFCSSGMRF